MQARALSRHVRPAAQAGRRRAAAVAAFSSSSSSRATTTLASPPPYPPAPAAQAPPPQTLRQLYPFAPEAHRQSAPPPPPLLCGTLPAAGSDGADANGLDAATTTTATTATDPHHRLYFEVRGNPLGLPALVLHGGPGAGSYPSHARFFDPERYCVVLFDQRGCGRSTPLGRLDQNDARALVRDAERLRAHLGCPAWACVLGGSWGSALALQYAAERPESLRSAVLRAVCSMRPQEEIGWLYGGGGAGPLLRPEAWRAFLGHVGMTAEGVASGAEDPLPAYYERLLSDDLALRDAAASAWMAYEWAVYCTRADDEPLLAAAAATAAAQAPPPSLAPAPSRLPPELEARGLAFPGVVAGAGPPDRSPTRADHTAAQALLLCHYSLHGGFVNGGGGGGGGGGATLLERVAAAAASGRLGRVSCSAFHGAADAVCPPRNARDLRAAWPSARVEVLPGGVGHSMYDPALVDAVVRSTDAAADAAEETALAGSAPLRARRLQGLMELEQQRRDAEVAVAAAALTRA